ncbi:MAG: hypothetical protein ACHQ52_15055 [Candidatus Eisenbacteria bacterium]
MKGAFRSRVIALVTAGALAAGPALAVSEEPTTEWSWEKFIDYSLCAAGIGLATTGAGLTLGLLACGKVVYKYWN